MGETSYNPAIGNSSSMIDGGYENYEYISNENQAKTGFGDLINQLKSPAAKQFMDKLFENILKLYDNLVNNLNAAQSILKTFLDDVVDTWKDVLMELSAPFVHFCELVDSMGSIQIMRAVSMIVLPCLKTSIKLLILLSTNIIFFSCSLKLNILLELELKLELILTSSRYYSFLQTGLGGIRVSTQ